MIRGAPSGTLGPVNPSGSMNADFFVQIINHFIKYSTSWKENPSYVFYDNHDGHLSIAAVNFAKVNGITILTVTPHFSSKIQPLDGGGFKTFSKAYNAVVDSWMKQHRGNLLSVYLVAAYVGFSHEKDLPPVI